MKKLMLGLALVSMVNVSAQDVRKRGTSSDCPVTKFVKSPAGIATGVVGAVAALYMIRAFFKGQVAQARLADMEAALGKMGAPLKSFMGRNAQLTKEVGPSYQELEALMAKLPAGIQSRLVRCLDLVLYPVNKGLVDPATALFVAALRPFARG